MAIVLREEEIEALIVEPKPLPENYDQKLRPRLKRGHREAELKVIGQQGRQFRVVLRQSIPNQFDYSAILVHVLPSGQPFRLRRYNGRHSHTNKLERITFHDFHIHKATERYQALGLAEDAFAEVTDRYELLRHAVDCLFTDCAFIFPGEGSQGRLFPPLIEL